MSEQPQLAFSIIRPFGDFPPVIVDEGNYAAFDTATKFANVIRQNASAQLEHAAIEGALLFRGFPLATAEDFDEVVRAFELEPFTYEQSLSNAVRVNRTERVFTANEAPPDVEIFLHHEMAQTPVSPRWLFFFCTSAAETGGATPICRSDRVFADLAERAPMWADTLEALGLRYTTIMPGATNAGSGQGRSWQATLKADTREQAETRLGELGYTWRWQPDDSLAATSPALPAVKRLADGTKSLYSQILAARLGWQNGERAVSLGDGSPLPEGLADLIVSLAADHTVDVVWQPGDFAVVDNWRVMHGRRPFGGNLKREILVAMAA